MVTGREGALRKVLVPPPCPNKAVPSSREGAVAKW
jgi:hypothetical protein